MVSDRVLAVARGETEADPLLAGGRVVDVVTEEVRRAHVAIAERIIASVGAGELGRPRDPFMTLSFLALEVVPSLKLTDLGLVDVKRFELVLLLAT